MHDCVRDMLNESQAKHDRPLSTGTLIQRTRSPWIFVTEGVRSAGVHDYTVARSYRYKLGLKCMSKASYSHAKEIHADISHAGSEQEALIAEHRHCALARSLNSLISKKP
jgi:hypothetical protein